MQSSQFERGGTTSAGYSCTENIHLGSAQRGQCGSPQTSGCLYQSGPEGNDQTGNDTQSTVNILKISSLWRSQRRGDRGPWQLGLRPTRWGGFVARILLGAQPQDPRWGSATNPVQEGSGAGFPSGVWGRRHQLHSCGEAATGFGGEPQPPQPPGPPLATLLALTVAKACSAFAAEVKSSTAGRHYSESGFQDRSSHSSFRSMP